MSAELLVNVTPRETRVALIENGALQEIFIERANRRGLVGNIYKGRVARVLPGMQAAFVDIGLDRAAFLHASDIADADARQVRDAPEFDDGRPRPARAEPRSILRNGASVTDLVRDGQEVLVQVIKDPLGTKGARADHPRVDSLMLRRLHARCLDTRGFRSESRTKTSASGCVTSCATAHGDTAGQASGSGQDQGEEWIPEDGYIVRTAAEGLCGSDH